MQILENYRQQIDSIDSEILELLGKRFAIVREVGKYKAEKGMNVVQEKRMHEVLDRVSCLAGEKNIDHALVREIYKMMIDYAHIIETAIVSGANSDKS